MIRSFPALRALTLTLLVAVPAARADFVTADFEDVDIGGLAHQANFSGSNSFTSQGFTFSNNFTSSSFGDYFSGFAVSKEIDNIPPNSAGSSIDYDHQFGAYAPQPKGAAGTGAGGSATYAVAYSYSLTDAVINLPDGVDPFSIAVANTTYVASSVLTGDKFSRAFIKGDYLKLTILGFSDLGAKGTQIGSTSIMLADDTSGTLILLDQFRTVDLTGLTGSKSLAFQFDTNVTNAYGPSIAPEAAFDNVTGVRSVPEPGSLSLLAGGAILAAIARRKRGRASI